MVRYGPDRGWDIRVHTLGSEHMQYAYDSRFMDYADRSSRHSARTISALLRKTLTITSVLDIGCAKGTWLNAWHESGIEEIMGVDGSYVPADELVIPRERFVAADLSRPIDLHRKFDLVQSLEVAEHIRPEASDQFVENLARHSAGVVLFSAAPQGQGGEFHVNEQSYDYWREKFLAYGFEAYDYIRPLIAHDKSVSFWYRFNTLLYVRKDAIMSLPEEIQATRVPDTQEIHDISPLWFRARKLVIHTLPFGLQQKLARFKARSASPVSKR
jgi:SAM-dependent methyltransferase